MSKIICSAAIRGAHKIVGTAEAKCEAALKKWGPVQELGFPNTTYYLPIIYGILGIPVKTLGDAKGVLDKCKELLPAQVSDNVWLPYLAPALEAGMATFFAEEIVEAIRYLEEPNCYTQGENPLPDNIWLGAADDVIMRKRGVEFVDGTAPGFAAILGAAPTSEIAAKIAIELQEKNLYVFMCADHEGKTMSEQLVEAGVQIGWPTRLVSFGPSYTATVFAMGFATRAAMSFGGVKPGDFAANLHYNKDRIFAFAMPLGTVIDEWYANAAGAINWGFPTIADTPIPEILPTGICTYEHVVSNIPHDQIVARAIEVRGLKVTISKVDIPMSYGPAFEGERIRKDDLYFECGGGRTLGVELTVSKDMSEVEDGKIEMVGPDLDQIKEGAKLPFAMLIEVAGRQMQPDFEPILERQVHHLVNYVQGIMHIGQRNIMWIRVGKAAVEKGLLLKHLGKVMHAKYHQDFGNIIDKVQIKIYTDEERVKEILEMAKKVYRQRDKRVEGMTDETEETYYSCTLCQSFAPSHVCIITPERTGMCGAYNWLDCKVSFEINPTGPNQPIEKGECIDPAMGQWKGITDFVFKASRQKIEQVSAYSLMNFPMTACGCFECVATILPMCNGIMVVSRDFMGMTPCGMKFTTLAGMVGGGNQTPGFLGVSKHYICSRKFLIAEGGLKRVVWLPKMLKEEIAERIKPICEEMGIPNFPEMIADDTIGTTEEEILPFLEEKGHPALTMDPLM
ncbi:MAG: CO dehydrogenase/CO-methylating acetyl-CoA synthase complex subunit beta [Desulfobacteraceae bacterium]|uniref:CO-methylating acetyl-CoA synthase n=1 Tax=Candidatus Desulfaltia bathyphila TaxID=2841697 RepID=A0A8J6T643_9BACT|nr:CO dehydrogenase/CO-methylating acetyl-CoA synthase complex subunit beta [Candidatus Desulfaltia bathyphila]MBL7194692.1 CO dehydrogenase/CO-methylating acetyl-CoA synthase complex subunit beta [Desulfobacterales bacterium]